MITSLSAVRICWLLCLGCEVLAVAHLVQSKLWRKLPAFTSYVSLDILTALALLWIDVQSPLYPRAYLITQWLMTVSLAGVGVEAFLLIVKTYSAGHCPYFLKWLGGRSVVRGVIAGNAVTVAAIPSLKWVFLNLSLAVLIVARLWMHAAVCGGVFACWLFFRLVTGITPRLDRWLDRHVALLLAYLGSTGVFYVAILYFPQKRMPVWDCMLLLWAAFCFAEWAKLNDPLGWNVSTVALRLFRFVWRAGSTGSSVASGSASSLRRSA